jgi:hypothetical protein
MTLRQVVWPLVLVGSTMTLAGLWLAGVDGPFRALVAFWFLLVCPGMAIVGLFDFRDLVTRCVAAVALSLALDCLIAMAMVYRVGWSPEGGFAVIAAISLAGALAQLWQRRTRTVAVVNQP